MTWISLAVWGAGIVLWFQYDGTRPVVPDTQIGRIHALNTHGHVVYLTFAEYLQLNGLLVAGFAGLVGVVAINLRQRGHI